LGSPPPPAVLNGPRFENGPFGTTPGGFAPGLGDSAKKYEKKRKKVAK
jgi:hypothetical protein